MLKDNQIINVKIRNVSQDEFDKKEIRRYFALKKEGWKCIKIISSNDKIPYDEDIVKHIDIAVDFIKKGNNWVEINYDDFSIKTYYDKIDINNLELRRIYKEVV